MKKEIWKDVPGYEGLYEASSYGKVRTLKRKRIDGRVYPEKILKQNINNLGYHSVTLYGNGISWKIAVHRLIAWIFIDNPGHKKTVNHKDGNRSNNNVSNLEWCSYSENIKHSYDNLGKKAWNKGLKGRKEWHNISGLNNGTPWNKGKKTGIVPKTAFKKGSVPWNKK